MSLTLIIIVNVALDATLLGGLAWVLSRPARLTPPRPLQDSLTRPP
jgi:hypothetical protein